MKTVPTLYIAEELIEKTINKFWDNIAVACSFGKDSMAVSQLARKIKPDILHVHYLGAPFPETVLFRQEMKKKLDLNLEVLRPYKGMNFWRCVEKYGLPHFRSSGKGKHHTPRCCYYLKEKPMQVFVKERGIKAVLTGITASESWNRYKLAKRYSGDGWKSRLKPETIKRLESIQEEDGWNFCSQRYWSGHWGSWQVHPLMSWTEEDVWEHTRQNDIPINPVYLKWGGIYDRVGYLPCTAYKYWEEHLRQSHPKLYLRLKKIEGATRAQMSIISFKEAPVF